MPPIWWGKPPGLEAGWNLRWHQDASFESADDARFGRSKSISLARGGVIHDLRNLRLEGCTRPKWDIHFTLQ